MLDIRSHSQLAESAADMMRACALATARAAGTSMLRSMSFWTHMLRAPASRPETQDKQAEPVQHSEPPQAPVEPQVDPAFSSYRSSGGHAVAQVIVADPEP